MKILLIEDEKITRITLSNTLKKEGYQVVSSATGQDGLDQFHRDKFDIVITDLRLPKTNGLEILKSIKETAPNCIVIIMTAYATVETAVEALKIGAYDYLTKPFSPDRLLSMLDRIRRLREVVDENRRLRKRMERIEQKTIVGNSPPMRKLLETVKVVAQNDYTVLLQGESGTGKEVIARALHTYSRRRNKPFVPINCAVIPESLLESELFGHEKGAFSGAINQHIGYFERANGGTIFLDDIDDFPLPLQVKLLRVLQEREFVRVGGHKSISVDVRIVCATKIDLRAKVDAKLFREDLFYRLNIIPLKIPPLRERKEDIPLLVEYFLEKRGVKDRANFLTPELYARLMQYNWPGNVRELENIVERMIALSELGTLDTDVLQSLPEPDFADLPQEKAAQKYPSYAEFMKQKEREIIRWAMDQAQNNVSRAAQLLGLPRSTLRSKMKKLF